MSLLVGMDIAFLVAVMAWSLAGRNLGSMCCEFERNIDSNSGPMSTVVSK